jgi:3-dehydroquinate dehydratase-1
MICVSIGEGTLEECLRVLEKIEFAEIRMENLPIGTKETHLLFSGHPRLIATCRPGTMTEQERKDLLIEAMRAGAAYVDIELESKDDIKNEVIDVARSCGCQVIISHHDFRATPARKELERLVDRCFDSRADICKIACRVHSVRDNAQLLGLLQDKRPIVAVGMGEKGKITRIMAPLLGSPFTYASLGTGKETAEGQIEHRSLERMLRSLRDV